MTPAGQVKNGVMWRKFLKNLSFLGSAAGNYDPFLPLFRLMKRRYPYLADRDSELCIEGFPRSGNTFLVAAIQRWNPGLRIAHHSHLAASARHAITHGIPTVILIREPAEAVASVMVWDGRVTPSVGLLAYTSFYRSLGDAGQKALLVPFRDAVKRPDAVVRALNDAFDLDIQWSAFSAEEEKAIKGYLQRHDVRNDREATQSSLPNEGKKTPKIRAREQIRASRLYHRAHSTWERLEGGSPGRIP